MTENAYAKAGVDTEAGDLAVELMKRSVAATHNDLVFGGLGGFALGLGQLQHGAVVAHGLAALALALGLGAQLVGMFETGVQPAGFLQPGGRRRVALGMFAVGKRFVPVQPQPYVKVLPRVEIPRCTVPGPVPALGD